MKRKLNIHLMGIAALAIISTLFVVSMVYYSVLKKQVFNDLKYYAHLLINMDFETNLIQDSDAQKFKEFRITLIRADGTVIYDNEADVDEMENHKSRPEVAKAIETGEGEDIRYSQTLKTSTFYYADKLEDGSILRVAKETSSVYAAFWSVIPVLILIVVLLFLVCMVCAYFITRSLISPIEKMAVNLGKINIKPSYKELVPFVEAIQKQHNDIIKVSEMRQEFTANVSHELKTPLASISGYSELIETGVASGDDVIHFAKEIHQNTNRLLVLINDIIRLSQLDSPEFELSFEDVNLSEIAKDCIDMLSLAAEQNEITLDYEGEEVIVQGDSAMLEEAVYNLVDNAIRYNKQGGRVLVTVKETGEGELISVADTGIGISKEDTERIFERFYRVDKSRSKQTGGTGLGLAIVKHISLKHEANIQVKSELGMGSVITVLFPKNKSL